MTTRTDIHSPTNMDPENYEDIWYLDNQSQPGWVLMGGDHALEISLKLHAADTLGRSVYQCHHCGARIRYVAIMRHIPTDTLIAVGETCLDNRFSLASKAEFDRLRKAAALDRAAHRVKTAALEFLAEHTDGDVNLALHKDTDLSETFHLEGYGLSTVSDIRRKLFRYGDLSEKQVSLVGRLVAESQARHSQPAPVEEGKIAAPLGKVTFRGTVVKVSQQWSDYAGPQGGYVTKLVVKVTTPEGIYLVYVTDPAALQGSERGDVVEMTATLSVGNQEHFAFGKRPSKAHRVSRPSEEPSEDSLAD